MTRRPSEHTLPGQRFPAVSDTRAADNTARQNLLFAIRVQVAEVRGARNGLT
jgi:hypothetical protein